MQEYVQLELMLSPQASIIFGSWKQKRPANIKALLIWDTLGALGMGNLQIPWKPSHQEIYILVNTSFFHGKRESDVIRFAPVQSMAKNGRIHPFEKPVKLIKYLITKTTAKTILDPFAGSGTTGVAAKELNKKCVLIELEEKYCEIAARRLSQEVFNFEEVKK